MEESLPIASVDSSGDIYLDKMEMMEQDKKHDLDLINAQIKRKAFKLAIGATIGAAVSVFAVGSDPSMINTVTVLANGYVAGGAAYLAPSLSLKGRLKKYYELEKESIEQDAIKEFVEIDVPEENLEAAKGRSL